MIVDILDHDKINNKKRNRTEFNDNIKQENKTLSDEELSNDESDINNEKENEVNVSEYKIFI